MLTQRAPGAALHVSRWMGDVREWNAVVDSDPESSFCHHVEWGSVIADVLGHECVSAVARDETGAVAGVLPLVRVASRITGHRLISMPFLNYGGPLGTRASRMALAGAALEEARRSGADALELRTRHAAEEPLQEAARKVTVVLPLAPTSDRMFASLPSKLRSQIRRPQRDGMVARFGPGHHDAFYEVFAHNMRDLGTPVLPRRFFEAIAARLGPLVRVGVVYAGGRPVAAGWGFAWRSELEITWASSLREHARSAPNMLLYWSFIEQCIAEGITSFNFGRCTPEGGTHRFKLQWGGATVPLPWSAWSRHGEAGPSHERPAFQLASRCWQRLPIAVANRLGPSLARLLP